MPTFNFDTLKDEYSQQWENMEIAPSKMNAIKAAANKINKGRGVYENLEAQTNVPWYFIGMLHLREGDCDFTTHLHNGDTLARRTTHVPAGRPLGGTAPFSFEYSAIDALKQKGYDRITDWSIERIAFCSEMYNGWGYRYRKCPSAYLWAGTNQYSKGKFIRDGVFSATTVDTQLGCMAVLKYILDHFVEAPAKPEVEIPITNNNTTPKAEVERPTNKEMNKVSKKHWWTNVLEKLGLAGLFGTGATTLADNSGIETLQNTAYTTKQLAAVIGASGLIVIFIGIVVYAMYMKKRMKDDVQEGRSIPSDGEPT